MRLHRLAIFLGLVLVGAAAPGHADPSPPQRPAPGGEPSGNDDDRCDTASGLARTVAVVSPDVTILNGITDHRKDALEAIVAACGAAAATASPDQGRALHRCGLALHKLGRDPEAGRGSDPIDDAGLPRRL